jgi:hypothetical protein
MLTELEHVLDLCITSQNKRKVVIACRLAGVSQAHHSICGNHSAYPNRLISSHFLHKESRICFSAPACVDLRFLLKIINVYNAVAKSPITVTPMQIAYPVR